MSVDRMSEATPPPWPLDRWPTPQEFVEWLGEQSPAGRLAIAEKLIEDLQRAHRCRMIH